MLPVADVIPSRTTPWVTLGLIAANVLTFLYGVRLDASDAAAWIERWAFTPADPTWASATTGLFLHENSLHLVVNALALWIFGDNVEDQLGHVRFGALILIGGYTGCATAVWAHPGSVVPLAGMGAPIAAVLAAYFVMFPQSRVLMLVPARHLIDAVELPAALVAAGWLTLHVLGGFGSLDVPTGRIGPIGRIGIDVWPFVGGAIAGLLAVWVARQPDRRRVEWWGP